MEVQTKRKNCTEKHKNINLIIKQAANRDTKQNTTGAKPRKHMQKKKVLHKPATTIEALKPAGGALSSCSVTFI